MPACARLRINVTAASGLAHYGRLRLNLRAGFRRVVLGWVCQRVRRSQMRTTSLCCCHACWGVARTAGLRPAKGALARGRLPCPVLRVLQRCQSPNIAQGRGGLHGPMHRNAELTSFTVATLILACCVWEDVRKSGEAQPVSVNAAKNRLEFKGSLLQWEGFVHIFVKR